MPLPCNLFEAGVLGVRTLGSPRMLTAYRNQVIVIYANNIQIINTIKAADHQLPNYAKCMRYGIQALFLFVVRHISRSADPF